MSQDDPIGLCLAGRISPEVALARLVLAGVSPERIAERVAARLRGPAAAPPPDPLPRGEGEKDWFIAPPLAGGDGGGIFAASAAASALGQLLERRRDGLACLSRMVAESGFDHNCAATAPDLALAATRAAFDRAVARSPEASVAAYSLGDPAILSAATAELVAWLEAEALLDADADVLDFGCGIGRVAAAVAPLCRSVLGVDLSPGMIAEARRRHDFPNLRFAVTGGSELTGLPASGFDLVLAVDSFPYLVQAGRAVAERHVADAARLLRPGGVLAILNLSYRGDPAADRADAKHWAAGYGFRLTRNGEAPFALWDGTAFVLRRVSRRRPGAALFRGS